jgi:hypothetical protein
MTALIVREERERERERKNSLYNKISVTNVLRVRSKRKKENYSEIIQNFDRTICCEPSVFKKITCDKTNKLDIKKKLN